MASLHLAVCTPNFKIQETFDDMVEPWVREAIVGRPEVRDGYFSVPEAPGLGVDLNENVIAAHPPKEGFSSRNLPEHLEQVMEMASVPPWFFGCRQSSLSFIPWARCILYTHPKIKE